MSRIGNLFFGITLLLLSVQLLAQPFTHADTLRGFNGPDRAWWDVLHYNITVQPNLASKTISASTEIIFSSNCDGNKTMQIDLQKPLLIDSIIFENAKVAFKNNFNNSWSVFLKGIQSKQYMDKIDGGKGWIKKELCIKIYYQGKPKEAINPPWNGGWIWKKDKNGNPLITIACQSLGASVWYPCKDIQSDEPDNGAELNIIVPDSLIAIGNGRLKEKKQLADGNTKYTWVVTSPINNYDIAPYIGKYVHFGEIYNAEAGKLDLDYWVLDYNLNKATAQFKEVPKMMKAFEYWFGPYPFYKDGYKLIETSHLGMEHQSAIAYGNRFKNGYLGMDRSGTGWGLKWDYIIVHESGHEWFGNNITTKDIADMWVQEGFTTYSEVLFTEFYFGKAAADEYINRQREDIKNDKPIIGFYNVNNSGSLDMYVKSAAMIHNIRQVINNDSLFRKILRGLNADFYHQTVTSKQIENYISSQSKIKFSKVFDQYLRTINIPVLEYKIIGNRLQYRYRNCVSGFNMPVKINFDKQRWIKPTTKWQTLIVHSNQQIEFTVDPNFFINTKKLD